MACITRTITGYKEEWGTGNSYFTVFLRSDGRVLDSFDMTMENQEILSALREDTLLLLGISNNTQCYLELISELGLEIPESYKKHWKPTLKEGTLWCYFVNSVGEIEGNSFSNSTFDNELVANFNIFPNKELAEKAVNLSKLGRLILLWQYANDCLFVPDWLDGIQYKYYIIYDSRDKNACYDYSFRQKSNNIHFETSEQVKAFIKVYDKEIKKIMGVIK